MTKTTTEQTPQSQAFDWQEDLVDEILTSDSGQWLLAATTGAGKTVAAFILLARMREHLPEARMFGAVPMSAGAGRFVERLRRWDSGGKVHLASPSWYRRRKSEYSDSEDIWGEAATYIFDSSLLQRPSAGSSLQEVSWDLGVVEDLDLLLDDSSQKDREDTRLWSTMEQLLISGQCDRFLALSREVRQPFSKPLTVFEQDLAIVEAQGVDFEQSVLEYERTEKEQDLQAELSRIEEFLAPNAKQSAGLIRRTFDAQISSFYAVDQWLYALKRLVEVSETAKSAKPIGLRTVDSEFWEGIEDLRSLWKQVDKAQLWVEVLLDRMAEVETDAKFEVFERFITRVLHDI